MCGIIACLLTEPIARNILIDGLRQLQNRGYDSAGIGYLRGQEFQVSKFASTESDTAVDLVDTHIKKEPNFSSGIAHTRWATHGPKTDINSHPHLSSDGKIIIVHNGIIENYRELQQMLLNEGYTFTSETDTEVIANLVAYYYEQTPGDIVSALRNATNDTTGTWGIVMLCTDYPNKVYCTRYGSPILVSHQSSMFMVSSEQSGFCKLATNYFVLKSKDICIAEISDGIISIKTENTYHPKPICEVGRQLTPDPYPHWTLKEIYEQTDSCHRAVSQGGRLLSDNQVKLGGLDQNIETLKDIDNIILLGCGTSYFAGQVGLAYFKELTNFNTVQLCDGAEFTTNDIPKRGTSVLVFLSQSGETKDLHRCITIGRENNIFMIGVVNVVDSMIAREVHCGCYLNAGREVAVASTKSFTSQVVILSMMAIWFSQIHDINLTKRQQYIKDLRQLPYDIQSTLTLAESKIPEVVDLLGKPSLFLLGKGKFEAIAKEGSLKIKEIAYLHAEGYSASSLKHGPFALLDHTVPVILLANRDVYLSKMKNVYEEVKSRHAITYVITNDVDMLNTVENGILYPENTSYSEVLVAVILQFIAYRLSVNSGINPDFPKNLAKVVTVE